MNSNTPGPVPADEAKRHRWIGTGPEAECLDCGTTSREARRDARKWLPGYRVPCPGDTAQQQQTAFATLAKQLQDLETRLLTDRAVLQSLVRGSEPDTPSGQQAREMLARVTRLLDGLGGLLTDDT
jgi:hypothetical protein